MVGGGPEGGEGEGQIGRLGPTDNTLYIKQIPNKDGVCNTGNPTQSSAMIYRGTESQRSGYMRVHNSFTLLYT